MVPGTTPTNSDESGSDRYEEGSYDWIEPVTIHSSELRVGQLSPREEPRLPMPQFFVPWYNQPPIQYMKDDTEMVQPPPPTDTPPNSPRTKDAIQTCLEETELFNMGRQDVNKLFGSCKIIRTIT